MRSGSSLGITKARNLKVDFMQKSIQINFFGLNTFLDVIEIPKPQKPCWPYALDTLRALSLRKHNRHIVVTVINTYTYTAQVLYCLVHVHVQVCA